VSILATRKTRLITQGITGDAGRFHTLACRAYGTKVVGGVTPGRGGSDVEGIPVFDTVRDAVEKTGANATMIFVPAAFAGDAVLEAAEAGLQLVVCITEGIPALDEVRVKRRLVDCEPWRTSGAALVGPNCPGVISPAV
jgi:succinyl-CoA synthetase alpha subunit